MDFIGRKILLVEDEVFTRKVLARVLTNLGFAEVEEAGDGAAGLAAVRTSGPDMVLCDVEMTPMDGFDFVAAVRNAGFDALPIVLMSNLVNAERMSRARAAGASALLAKPVRAETLRRALEA